VRNADHGARSIGPGFTGGARQPDDRLQDGDKATGARAIHRALAILECFETGPRELGINDLAKSLSLSPSTVHRIVRALVERGYLAQNEQSNRYTLGPTMIVLGQVTQRLFGLDRVVPLLEEVGRRYGESVTFGMRDGASVVVLAQVDSTKPMRFSHPPGTRLPLYASALGKALLAGARHVPAELRALGRLRALTARTLHDHRALSADLATTLARGYAIDDEESVMGVRAVAAPVVGRGGEVIAALGIEGPSEHLPDAWVKQIGKELPGWAQRVAKVISL
jgi:IclR family acetate operon transcriptional repressor